MSLFSPSSKRELSIKTKKMIQSPKEQQVLNNKDNKISNKDKQTF